MGDHDHSRERRRKKYNRSSHNKDKEKEENLFSHSRKTPLILTKQHAEKTHNVTQPKIIEPPPQPVQPTIILKSRDASSPNPKVKTKESDGSLQGGTNNTKLSTSAENVQALLAPYPLMTFCHKLIDDCLLFHNGLQEFFTDQTDFLVIGVVGLQGSGKSTILSHLINDSNSIFKAQCKDEILTSTHCTAGVDIYITSNRIILLDTQPILSPSLFNMCIKNGQTLPIYDPLAINKNTMVGAATEYSTVENSIEIQSLQLSTFIFSVCHVVLFVQDWLVDPNFIRFIQATEMLKPANFWNRSEEYNEYFPEGIFIHNKVRPCDFMKQNVADIQDFYSSTFSKSKLFVSTGKSFGGEDLNRSSPNDSTEVPLCNVYMIPTLPQEGDNAGKFTNHPEFSEVMRNLKRKILGSTRRNLTINNLSEKNWLLYAKKVWEYIRKNSYFLEYNKLMP